jgi:hypothetical protein
MKYQISIKLLFFTPFGPQLWRKLHLQHSFYGFTDQPLVYPLSNMNNSSTFTASSQDRFISPSIIWQVGWIDDLLIVLDCCSPLMDEAIQMWENVTSKLVNSAMAMAMTTSVTLNKLDSVSVLVHFCNQSQANYSHEILEELSSSSACRP